MRPLVGQPAPDFTAVSTQGDIRLSDFRGKSVVLYFYPKDSTPGCTTQAQNFRDQADAFESANAVVLGVSRDSIKSHENFREKQALNFTLVSDPDETVCLAYDVMKLKNMYGKQVRGIERSTFLVDARGLLVQEWRGLKVPGHVGEVLGAVKALG
jgi:peroxiredoxin Q/BCP